MERIKNYQIELLLIAIKENRIKPSSTLIQFFLTNLKLNQAMKIKRSSVCAGWRKSQARARLIELRIREEPEIDEDLRTGFEQTADFITVVINVNQRILVELLRHFLINFIFDGTEFSKQSVKLDRYLLHSVGILKIVTH